MINAEPPAGAAQQNDVLLDPAALPWVRVSPTLELRLLHWDRDSGAYTLMMRYAAGAVIGPHRHLAAAEFYVVSGRMVYVAGEAGPGFFGVEPKDAVHMATRFPEETVLLFRCGGATERLDESGKVIGRVEGRDWHAICSTAQ